MLYFSLFVIQYRRNKDRKPNNHKLQLENVTNAYLITPYIDNMDAYIMKQVRKYSYLKDHQNCNSYLFCFSNFLLCSLLAVLMNYVFPTGPCRVCHRYRAGFQWHLLLLCSRERQSKCAKMQKRPTNTKLNRKSIKRESCGRGVQRNHVQHTQWWTSN